jgi:hypothetical protein
LEQSGKLGLLCVFTYPEWDIADSFSERRILKEKEKHLLRLVEVEGDPLDQEQDRKRGKMGNYTRRR